MDWPLIIERNRERILLVIAPLLAVLGFDQRRREEVPPAFPRLPHHAAAPRRVSCAPPHRDRRDWHCGEAAAGSVAGFCRLSLAQKLEEGFGRRRGALLPAFPAHRSVETLCGGGLWLGSGMVAGLGQGAGAAAHLGSRPFDPVFAQAVPVPNRYHPIATTSLLRRIRSL